MNQDEQHLDLLAIFHYIVGGLTALFSCVLLFHIGIGMAIMSGAFGRHGDDALFGLMFIIVPGALMLMGWTLAVVIIVAGRKLKRRQSRTFCLVVAGLECFLMPFGTVLGVFTIIVLMRESVMQIYETAAIARQ